MSDREPVRIAMLGAAHGHATGKTRWLQALPEVDFAGVYEPDPAVRADRARRIEHQHVPWIDSIDSILEDGSIVGVVIGGAEQENPPYARRALAAGKHVLMEKACGWTKAHADELIGTAERKGLLFQMGYNFRLMPHVRRVLDMAAAGELGDIHAVRCHMGSFFQSEAGLRLSDGQRYFSGGFMYNLGCHALDMVMGVLGVPEAVHPYLRCDFYKDEPYVDNVHVVLEYERAIASIEVDCLGTEGKLPRSLEVLGSRAQAIASPFMPVNDVAPAVAVHAGGREAGAEGWRRYGCDPYEPFRPCVEEFVACICGEKRPRFGYEHDRAVHHVLMDICGESDVIERER